MTRALFVTILIILIFVLPSRAQKASLYLDDLAFPCIEYKKGNSINDSLEPIAYLFDYSKSPKLDLITESLKSVAKKKDSQQTIVFAFKGNYETEQLNQKLISLFGERLYIKAIGEEWPDLDSLRIHNKQIIAIFNDDLCVASTATIQDSISYSERFSSDPQNKLFIYEPQNTDSLFNECLRVWKLTGKVPNLVVSPQNEIKQANSTFSALNKLRRFKAIFKHGDELVNEIYWKNRPGLITPAKLSYPLIGYKEIFTPYKNGYSLSPGEVIHHTALKDIPRKFNAYESSLEDQLMMHFSFDKRIENLVDPAWDRIKILNAQLKKDDERGQVLNFTEYNSFIDYSKKNELNFDTPISVAAWIKPDSIHQFMGIIGLGSSFSIKLFQGNPDFTTATIKDHQVDNPLELNKWHHLTIVFNPNTKVEFYINGEKSTTINASEILPSEQSLIIGNNIWGEQFYGSIDDLKIWDRGLSSQEVKAVYLDQDGSSSSATERSLFAIALLLIGLFAVMILSKKRKTKKQIALNTPNEKQLENKNYQVQLFGRFQFCISSSEKITERFSPLLRQMLAFFILNTQESPEGISTKKITDTFWPGTTKEKAKENRGTNIKKLRKLLEHIPGIEILYQNKKWQLELSPEFKIDFIAFSQLKTSINNQLANQAIQKETLQELLVILKQGNILQNLEQEWLDPYKNQISDEVIKILLRVLPHISKKPNLTIDTAKAILQFDHLNEDALKCILLTWVAQGNHGQAQQFYSEFCKKYFMLYNEEYPNSYTDIIKN